MDVSWVEHLTWLRREFAWNCTYYILRTILYALYTPLQTCYSVLSNLLKIVPTGRTTTTTERESSLGSSASSLQWNMGNTTRTTLGLSHHPYLWSKITKRQENATLSCMLCRKFNILNDSKPYKFNLRNWKNYCFPEKRTR